MAHLLLETPLGDQQRQYATTARDSGQALLTILNDILDFSKMEAGKLELVSEDFDLASVVSSVTGLFASWAHEKGLDLESAIALDVPLALRGDAGRLRQALLNFVGNAIKFTERGRIQIGVARVGERGDLGRAFVSTSRTVGSVSLGRRRGGCSRNSARWISWPGTEPAAPTRSRDL